MNRLNPKFPIWAKIFIAIIILLMIVGIFFVIKVHETYYTYREDAPPVGLIVTIIITGTIAIANVILVGFTKIYADQTTRMADETAEMTRQHQEQWHLELRPLFVPVSADTDHKDNPTFKFRNYGDLALFVKCGITGELYDEYKFVEPREYITFQPHDFTDLLEHIIVEDINNPHDAAMVLLQIDYQDKLAIKYRQNIKFYLRKDKWDFHFDESCLPVELD